MTNTKRRHWAPSSSAAALVSVLSSLTKHVSPRSKHQPTLDILFWHMSHSVKRWCHIMIWQIVKICWGVQHFCFQLHITSDVLEVVDSIIIPALREKSTHCGAQMLLRFSRDVSICLCSSSPLNLVTFYWICIFCCQQSPQKDQTHQRTGCVFDFLSADAQNIPSITLVVWLLLPWSFMVTVKFRITPACASRWCRST